ncbi:MAG: SCP2 sterol-binding domain-containing protein [Bacillota bacterium]
MATAAEFLKSLVQRMNDQPERTGIKDAAIQFVLTGDGGGSWAVVISQGKAELKDGPVPNANVTIEMSVADFQEMSAGRLGPVAAYMSGRLRIQGDMGLAMRLQPLLS